MSVHRDLPEEEGTNFPLGPPVNRAPPSPEWVPIPGRPQWYRDRHGAEKFFPENLLPNGPVGTKT